MLAVGPAGAAAQLGGGDHPALGGVDGGTLGGRDINAGVVLGLVGKGVLPVAIERGQGVLSGGQRPQEAGLADHILDLVGVLLLLPLDLRVQVVGRLFQLGLHLLQLILPGADLPDKLIDLVFLLLQLLLDGNLLLLGLLLLALGLLQSSPVRRHLGLEGLQVLHHLVVILDDLLDHHVVVQKLGKAAGGKQNGPVGDLPLLLHLPHPAAKEVELSGLVGLGLTQLLRLFGDQLVVHGNLLVDVVDLLADDLNLTLDQLLFIDGGVFVRLDGLQLVLDVLALAGQVVGVPLQRVDLRLGHGGGLQHRPRSGQGEQKRQDQEQPRRPAQKFSGVAHSRPSPTRTSGCWLKWAGASAEPRARP